MRAARGLFGGEVMEKSIAAAAQKAESELTEKTEGA